MVVKKYLKYKPSRIEWIGNLPEHWNLSALKFNVEIKITDGPHETPEFVEEGIPFVSAEAVQDGKVILSSCRGKITKELDQKYSEKCKPKRGDVFVVKSGSTTGKVAYVDFDDDFNIWSPLALIRSDKKNDSRFIFYALSSEYFQKNVQLFWSFGTQPNIGMNVLENLRVVSPPLSEQQFIASYLDRKTQLIDETIRKKERLIELLQEERTALINQAVTKGLDPNVKMKDSGVEWLGEVPAHWEVVKLKFLISGKLEYGANESAESVDISQPRYIRITDFGDDGKLRPDTFKSLPQEKAKDYMLEDGDILFARSGATVGKTFFFKNYIGEACFAGYLIRARVNSQVLQSAFLYYFTKSRSYENWKDSIFNQATIQNIGADKYSVLICPVPPISV